MQKEYPDVLISRISMYYRLAQNLLLEGKQFITSREIARRLGITDAQVRKDLSFFGQFGVRKKGYPLKFLADELANVLGLSRVWRIAIFGIGHLGYALASYNGFRVKNFSIEALFDVKSEKIGKEILGTKIYHFKAAKRILKEKEIDVVIITTPSRIAQQVADVVVKAGIKAILNFASVCLQVPSDVKVIHADMASYIEMLTFYLSQSI